MCFVSTIVTINKSMIFGNGSSTDIAFIFKCCYFFHHLSIERGKEREREEVVEIGERCRKVLGIPMKGSPMIAGLLQLMFRIPFRSSSYTMTMSLVLP